MSKLKKALEKAREARSGKSPAESVGTFMLSRQPEADAAIMEIRRNEISVEYSQTRVHETDPKIFEKNKVAAFFRESLMSDQINLLRTQVLSRLAETGGNSLLITSANPGEGKTFMSLNLGISIARELDKTALLVDADLRNPTQYHRDFANDYLGVKPRYGLADYLIRDMEISGLLLNPGIQKLTILPGGRPMPNSAELLGSPKMESMMKELRSRYSPHRIIIVDSPSMMVCTDPVVLSRYTDAVLLVVEEESTSSEDLKRCLELLAGKSIIGTVLNKSNQKRCAVNV